MKDGQRTKLYVAEDAIWRSEFNPRLSDSAAVHLINEVTAAEDLPEMQVSMPDTGQASIIGTEMSLPPWARCPLLILHELSHLTTHHLFPPHGAEFAAGLLVNITRFASPALADELRRAYDKVGVHYDSITRAARFRRVVVNAANQTEGVLAEVILDQPPERVVGPIHSLQPDHVCVGDRVIELSRGRYVNLNKTDY